MKNYQFRLIDSTYSSEDASELLMALVSEKIRFLNEKISTLETGSEQKTHHLETRIRELKSELRTLELMLDEYDGEEADFGIRCSVQMSVKTPVISA
ncbi:hypothetical protein [Phaeocystidibacter luteus]|uniref:Uncharacterized protein n=1 Tax=Phaeocystidibacter luteus TaxID=911197 RepID=A0A6N6RKY7_9FLAO|nr:hypothetical protein [Phaeocystidibacter luteus]KAB2810057.1 hypothetical protein F8C67_07420 [Phaeocystidibacter luteus]